MSCAHCEELEERVAWLESELGLQREMDLVDRIRDSLATGGDRQSKRNGAAKLVAALYSANGRAVTHFQLLEAVPSTFGNADRNIGIVKVWVCWARKSLGRDSIANVWGRGYRLTPQGMLRVNAIANPKAAAA